MSSATFWLEPTLGNGGGMNLSLEEKRIAYALNEACLYIKRLLDGGGGCNDTLGWNVCVRREEWENHEPYIRIILCGAYRVREELQAIFLHFSTLR